MEIKLKSHLVIREETDNYALLYNPKNGATFVLNPVSHFICQKLAQSCQLDHLLATIQTTYEPLPPEAQKEVTTFIDQLLTNNLAEKVS